MLGQSFLSHEERRKKKSCFNHVRVGPAGATHHQGEPFSDRFADFDARGHHWHGGIFLVFSGHTLVSRHAGRKKTQKKGMQRVINEYPPFRFNSHLEGRFGNVGKLVKVQGLDDQHKQHNLKSVTEGHGAEIKDVGDAIVPQEHQRPRKDDGREQHHDAAEHQAGEHGQRLVDCVFTGRHDHRFDTRHGNPWRIGRLAECAQGSPRAGSRARRTGCGGGGARDAARFQCGRCCGRHMLRILPVCFCFYIYLVYVCTCFIYGIHLCVAWRCTETVTLKMDATLCFWKHRGCCHDPRTSTPGNSVSFTTQHGADWKKKPTHTAKTRHAPPIKNSQTCWKIKDDKKMSIPQV